MLLPPSNLSPVVRPPEEPPPLNPVYVFGGAEYEERNARPVITPGFVEDGPLTWSLPAGQTLWSESTLNPFAFQYLGSLFGFFDTANLVRLIKEHVRFAPVGLPGGLSGRQSSVGTVDGVVYMRNVLLPQMLRDHQVRKATGGELRKVIVHPIFMEPKSKQGTFRMIHNLSAALFGQGTRWPSFNAATPHHLLPKVGLCKVREILETLALLDALGYRGRIRGATIDLKAAYYSVRVHISDVLRMGFLFDGVVYVANGLPFGAKASPATFCRFVNLVWFVLLSLRIMNFWYMDDGLVLTVGEGDESPPRWLARLG